MSSMQGTNPNSLPN